MDHPVETGACQVYTADESGELLRVVCCIPASQLGSTWNCSDSDCKLTSSDISVSKINLVSIIVLCVTHSFQFLLYFYFEHLFRFSFQFAYHFYFSSNCSFYFSFQVDYVVHKINNTDVTTLLHKSNLASRSLLVCCLLYHTVTSSLCSVSKTHASPDF